jgi:catechol 2,3-dioxygenase-like lactoylglutathione lyase family enzyme
MDVKRTGVILKPTNSRVVIRPFEVANENRIAFWAESRAEVDRLTEIVRQADGLKLEGPEVWREYSPGYYAVFFEDPSGNKLEICCRESRPS